MLCKRKRKTAAAATAVVISTTTSATTMHLSQPCSLHARHVANFIKTNIKNEARQMGESVCTFYIPFLVEEQFDGAIFTDDYHIFFSIAMVVKVPMVMEIL